MKSILYIVICLTILGSDQMKAQENNRLITLTEQTIALFKCSVTAVNYKFYGLSSEKSLENIRIGKPIIHRAVTLRDLKGYTEAQDPKQIINEMGYVTVPLYKENGAMVEAFALLNARGEKYESTGIGEDYISQRFMKIKRSSDQEVSLVRIPGLNLAYAAFDLEGELNLISLTERDPKQESFRLASEVFAEAVKRLPKGEDVPH